MGAEWTAPDEVMCALTPCMMLASLPWHPLPAGHILPHATERGSWHSKSGSTPRRERRGETVMKMAVANLPGGASPHCQVCEYTKVVAF